MKIVIAITLIVVATLTAALLTKDSKQNFGWQPPSVEQVQKYQAEHEGSFRDIAPTLFK